MGIVLTDYVIESVIREGLNELKADPTIIDNVMSQLVSSYLKTDYGQQTINELKDYVQKNKIYVYQSYGLQGNKMPCYSINLASSIESEREAAMQDRGTEIINTIEPVDQTVYFTPLSYNSVTKTVAVPNTVNLSDIKVGSIFVDASDAEFQIYGGIDNTSGSKSFIINVGVTDAEPNVSGQCIVRSNIVNQILECETVPFRETILIACYAQNDPNIAKFMYYILMYILHRKKSVLEARGIELSNITSSDFAREGGMTEPEHVYSRYVTLSCLTRFTYTTDKKDVFGDVSLGILVPVDQVETNDPTRTVNTEPL